MRKLLVFVALALAGSASAGEMTDGLTITGGHNSFARLMLERADAPDTDQGVLKLRVSLEQAKNLKGYGFSLIYDPAKYEFLEAREVDGSLLSARSEQNTLFLSSNRTPGKLDIGAMKVDGQGASGDGDLVELVFKATETPLATDFQIAEGVLVGLDGNIDLLTQIEIGNLKPLPDRTALSQNMPNPFNPSTMIAYQIAEAGQVRLAIYNLLGQEVRVLEDARTEAGHYTANWDGKDHLGRQVASGIYLYRLQSANFSATKRMMLLK
jgi:hypothetical protein